MVRNPVTTPGDIQEQQEEGSRDCSKSRGLVSLVQRPPRISEGGGKAAVIERPPHLEWIKPQGVAFSHIVL